MKKISLVLLALVFIASCKKEASLINAEKVSVFYRLAIKDIDEQVAYSHIVSTKALQLLSTTNPGNSGGSGNDGNEGNSQNHFDGDSCNPNTIDFCAKHPWHKKCIRLLPIKLEYLVVRPNSNRVKIMWKVSLEENVESYNIERSMDALNFKVVGKVSPAGISTDYEFTDEIK